MSGFREAAIESATEQALRSVDGYDDYDRIAARDYALEYTSDAEKYCNCGKVYGVDYDYWNNSEYPYFDNACHNDCADYVSQAMHEGGIPIDPGKWERLKDGDNGWSWTYVPALEDYMTSMGYWDSSTFAECNAECHVGSTCPHLLHRSVSGGATSESNALRQPTRG